MEIVPRPDEEPYGEASPVEQSADDPDMIDPTADPLDTDAEDADLFRAWSDEEAE